MTTSSRSLRNRRFRGYFLALLMASTLLRPLPVLACTTDQDPDPDDWTSEDTTEDTTQDPTTDEVSSTEDTTEDSTTAATTDDLVTLDPFIVTADTEEPTTWDWNTTEWETSWWDTTWEETTWDFPEPTTTCDCDSCSNPNYAGSPNQFNAFDGNAKRQIDELEVLGARGQLGLKFARFHNTHSRGGAAPFGGYSNWRHSWQYDLTPIKLNGQPAFEFVEPSGMEVVLHPVGTGRWVADPGRPERAYVVADGIRLELAGGVRVFFRSAPGVKAATRFEARTVTDGLGFVTKLAYDPDGNLTRITAPGGKSITLTYQRVAYERMPFETTLAHVAAAAGTKQWVECTLPDSAAVQRYVRVRSEGGDAAIAEIQFLRSDGAVIVHGSFAAGTGANLACDSDDETIAKFGKSSFVGVEAGGDNPAVRKVRVLAAAGHESELSRLVVEGAAPVPTTRLVVAEAASSDGQVVKYRYANATFPHIAAQVSLLQRADYEDGSSAQYKYAFPQSIGARPQLFEADDPRFNGRAKQVRYTYHDSTGTVHEETNPTTGAVYASLELSREDPHLRIVRYSDLKQETFRYDRQNRLIAKSDGLGRITKWDYARDGKGPATARTDRVGRRTEWTQDNRGRILTTKIDGKVTGTAVRDSNAAKLTRIDRNGRTVSLSYVDTPRGKAKRVEHADHTMEERLYDKNGRVSEVRTRDNRVFRYTYDVHGNMATQTDALGNVQKYEYDIRSRVVAKTDAIGRVTRYEYTGRNQISKEILPDGSFRQFTYDKYGRKISATDEHGLKSTYTYDSLGRLRSQVDPLGRTTTFDYADLPQGCSSCSLASSPSSIHNPDGTVETKLYDAVGRLIASTQATGTRNEATTTFVYDDDDNVVAITDPLGRKFKFTYDSSNRRTSVTDPQGRSVTYSYTSSGKLATVTDAAKHTIQYTYDSNDRVTSVTDQNGGVTRTSYDPSGRIASTSDRAGSVHTYSYDAAGRRTAIEHPDHTKHSWEYDAVGRLQVLGMPDGLRVSYSYDSADHITRVEDNLGRTMAFTYDAAGRRLTAKDALGKVITWTYDEHGNNTGVTLPDGSNTTSVFDDVGRPVSISDGLGAARKFAYNSAGDLSTYTDARGFSYQFGYDELHRRTSVAFPDGTSELKTFDSVGRLLSFKNRAGQSRRIAYNTEGQPAVEAWSAAAHGENTAYTYDGLGRLSALANGNARLSYTYDSSNRIRSETIDLSEILPGSAPLAVKYRYDALGRYAGIDYPTGTEISYEYDKRSRLVSIEQSGKPVVTYDYDQSGRVMSIQHANKVDAVISRDPVGNVTRIHYARGGKEIATLSYGFDQAGRKASREDGLGTRYFTYDRSGQLTKVTSAVERTGIVDSADELNYDAAGNLTDIKAGSSSCHFDVNSLNQCFAVRKDGVSQGITYDANGNLVEDQSNIYVFDAQNRLVSATPKAGTVGSRRSEFSYDPRGRCVLRRYYTLDHTGAWTLDRSASIRLIYDLGWNLLADVSLDGRSKNEYVHGLNTDEVVLATVNSRPLYPLPDANGNIFALTDQTGAAVARFDYTAQGAPSNFSYATSDAGAAAAQYRLLFAGHEWLADAKLVDFRNRYLHTEFRRWMSPDPLGLSGGENLYAFCGNDPVNISDPYGLNLIDGFLNGASGSVGRNFEFGSISLTIGLQFQRNTDKPGRCDCYNISLNVEIATQLTAVTGFITGSMSLQGGLLRQLADYVPRLEAGGGVTGGGMYCKNDGSFSGNPLVTGAIFVQGVWGDSSYNFPQRTITLPGESAPLGSNGFFGQIRLEVRGKLNVLDFSWGYDGTYAVIQGGYRYNMWTWSGSWEFRMF